MSLTEALDRLAHESDQLAYHAGQNTAQAGPFTSAYLYLEPGSSVLSLIRDAAPKEKRPFKILSAPSPALPHSEVDKRPGVQLKTEAVLTPLKSLRSRRGQPGELDATLRAAEELLSAIADSYHMAKYQAHVRALSQQHAEQRRELAALQAEIDAFASRPAKEPEPEPEKEEISIDDAIRAEEAALRELERSIAPLRRASASPAKSPRSPMATRSPKSPKSPRSPTTPKKTPVKPLTTATPSRALQFPGTTPRRPAQTPRGRFEPLHLFGTPRARTPQVAPALRESIRREETVGRSIFGPGAGRRSTQQAPLDASVRKEPLDTSTRGLASSMSERALSDRPLGGSTSSAAGGEQEPSLAESTLQPPSLRASALAPPSPLPSTSPAPPTPAPAAPPSPAPPAAPEPPTPAKDAPPDIDTADPAVIAGIVSSCAISSIS